MSEETEFTSRVREIVCKIPCGQVTTYGAISAYWTGSKNSSQAVGQAIKTLRKEYSLYDVPVHRVVSAKRIIPNAENVDELAKEGITIDHHGKTFRVRDFGKCFWNLQNNP